MLVRHLECPGSFYEIADILIVLDGVLCLEVSILEKQLKQKPAPTTITSGAKNGAKNDSANQEREPKNMADAKKFVKAMV